MREDLWNVKIENEKQFIKLFNQLNVEIEFQNITKPKEEKEPLLDIGYLLKRYRKLKYQEEKNVFRKLHDCESCLYYKKPKRCPAIPKKGCPLESGQERKDEKMPKQFSCLKDREGNCPYGNEVGTCFGVCWKEILSVFYKQKHR